MLLSGAEIVTAVLHEQKVNTVFGYPGAMVLDVYDALYRDGKIEHILSAHEQGAAHAADGYARACGKTGVVIATSGPGATNLVTGIAAAYMDSVPLVAITANVSSSVLGHDCFQETDITGVTMPVTKYNMIAADINTLADDLRRCFKIASSGRKGPVLIDIPVDVLRAKCEYRVLMQEKEIAGDTSFSAAEKNVEENTERVAALIKNAKRPLIYAGGGVVAANASEELYNLAQKCSIPVVCSMMGLGAFNQKNPLYMGMAGTYGNPSAMTAVRNCDLLIAVGVRFSDRSGVSRETLPKGTKVIHTDIDNAEIDKNIVSDISFNLDALTALRVLKEKLEPKAEIEWLDFLRKSAEKIKDESAMKRIMKCIQSALGDDAIVVTDVGQHQLWAAQHCTFTKPRQFISSGGLGAMGFGLGAAIGAKKAFPNRPVVLITGDGSFHMNSNELATVKKYNLDIKTVVMNNGVLGMVRQWQWLKFENRFSQTEPGRKTSFSKLARAYGVRGVRVKNNSAAEKKIRRELLKKGAAVIDLEIPSNEIVVQP